MYIKAQNVVRFGTQNGREASESTCYKNHHNVVRPARQDGREAAVT